MNTVILILACFKQEKGNPIKSLIKHIFKNKPLKFDQNAKEKI